MIGRPQDHTAGALTAKSLRRLRLRLTLLYVAVSALGLGALGVFVVVADGKLRSNALDSDLRLQAAQAVRTIWYDEKNRLQRGGVKGDESLAAGYPQLYVIQKVGADKDGNPKLRIVVHPRTPWYEGAPLTVAATDAVLGDGEVVQRGRAGGNVPVRVLALPFKDNKANIGGAVAAVADETQLLATQHRLKLYVALGGGGLLLLSALAGFLLAERSIRPATRALERQERFLADAAHELRTPIAAIRALAEGAAAGDQPPGEATARMAEIAADASRTVDDLLFLARADAGRIQLRREPVRLDLLVDELVEGIPGLTLSLQPVVVEADGAGLRRALVNLVGNAVQHGRALDPAAQIEVTVTRGIVTVADRGPGIEPALEGLLFERFRSGRRTGGTGLGLPLARLIVEGHGGKLELAPRAGGGTVATLTVPGARIASEGEVPEAVGVP